MKQLNKIDVVSFHHTLATVCVIPHADGVHVRIARQCWRQRRVSGTRLEAKLTPTEVLGVNSAIRRAARAVR